MLSARGARVLQADRLAHDLMMPGNDVYDEVVRHFGRGILASGGSIDRKKLADAAFADGRIHELNRIVHPAVLALQESMMDDLAREGCEMAVVEAALIVEAGAQTQFDALVVVTCGAEQKIERFARRHQMDRAAAAREVERRMAAQLPDADKIRVADFVIDNAGDLSELERRVDVVYRELERRARQKLKTGN